MISTNVPDMSSPGPIPSAITIVRRERHDQSDQRRSDRRALTDTYGEPMVGVHVQALKVRELEGGQKYSGALRDTNGRLTMIAASIASTAWSREFTSSALQTTNRACTAVTPDARLLRGILLYARDGRGDRCAERRGGRWR